MNDIIYLRLVNHWFVSLRPILSDVGVMSYICTAHHCIAALKPVVVHVKPRVRFDADFDHVDVDKISSYVEKEEEEGEEQVSQKRRKYSHHFHSSGTGPIHDSIK
jgi:hypothetical protein